MKRQLFLVMAFITLFSGIFSTAEVSTNEYVMEFSDVISFSLNNSGELEEVTSEYISFHPAGGGWFSVEILIPSKDLPPEMTNENEKTLLQACISKMSENFTEVSVPRQDIIVTEETVFFHTQDVSYESESDYLVFSDGFLFWTPKGIVALWFASLPGYYIQESFIESILSSLRLIDPDGSSESVSKLVFSPKELQSVMAKEKLHLNLLKSSTKYQHLIEPINSDPILGDASFFPELELDSKEWMKNRENRTIFSVVALMEAIVLDSRVGNVPGEFTSFYTGRNSSTVISAFVFTATNLIAVEYDEKNEKIVVSVSTYDGTPISVLDSIKKKRLLSSYYENDIQLANDLIAKINESANDNADETDDHQATVTNAPIASTNETSSSFKESMDSLEVFFDEYVTFMEKYESSDSPISMLSDYSSMMGKYVDAMEKLEGIDESKLSTTDQKYYIEVLARINQKLANSLID